MGYNSKVFDHRMRTKGSTELQKRKVRNNLRGFGTLSVCHLVESGPGKRRGTPGTPKSMSKTKRTVGGRQGIVLSTHNSLLGVCAG